MPLIGAATCALLLTVGAVAPSLAQTKKEKARQDDKNLMRNLGTGLGAIAVERALKGKTNDALIAGAAAAYAGKKYEDDRKKQARESRKWVFRHGKKVGYYPIRHGKRCKFVRL